MLVGVLIAMVYAQHGSWQDKYTNAEGMRCCGPVDCQAVPVSIVLHDGAQSTGPGDGHCCDRASGLCAPE